MLGDHGQPIPSGFNQKRRSDRTVDELLGLAKGIIADEDVNQQEAEFLQKWLKKNHWASEDPMVNKISARVETMLVDNILDHEEQKELLELLSMFTGVIPPAEEIENMTSTLPLDQPAPDIIFEDKAFCFTGKFLSGSRKDCHRETMQRGGMVKGGVSKIIDYLVIGIVGSRDWIHTSYGRKIENVMNFKRNGCEIYIVSEDHWIKQINP